MRTPLVSLLAAAIAPFAAAENTPAPQPGQQTAETSPAEEKSFQAGDPAPAELLPTTWVRGEPVNAMKPGVTYVFVVWNTTGGHRFAPGYNIAHAMQDFEGNPAIKAVVVMVNEKLSPEKLAKRLARPSQSTPFPIAHALPGSDSEKIFFRVLSTKSNRKRGGSNTLVVRDGRILQVCEAGYLDEELLRHSVKPDFNYEAYEKWKTKYHARTRELLAMLMTDLTEAEKAGDADKVRKILTTLDSEPDLHPFVFSRLCDTKCSIAMEKGDMEGAVAAMRVLSDKYPESAPTQAWVYKVILQTDELYKPGLGLAALAAERMAKIKNEGNKGSWWQAAAKYRLELGDKPGALAAMEESLRHSPSYERLERMKAQSR